MRSVSHEVAAKPRANQGWLARYSGVNHPCIVCWTLRDAVPSLRQAQGRLFVRRGIFTLFSIKCANIFPHELIDTQLLFRFLLIAFLCAPGILSAQQPDSSNAAPLDSLPTSGVDSLKTLTPPSGSQVEGKIKYWAESISFSIADNLTHLHGNAKIEYQAVTLTAETINIDWTKNKIIAEGVAVADSVDSLGLPVYRGQPILTERGSGPIEGYRLEYDFKNNRGKVLEGKTKIQPGYYRGEDIRKVGQETLFIEGGCFTTCDLDHPHFHFCSSKMRVRLNKEANAKPVVLYIADVPIIGVPFAVFSLRRGRRSGIILPTFGQNSFGGRFLENFGYYWAPSDYWDATLLGTFYEKTGILMNGNFNYKKRYSFNGSVRGSYSPKDVTTGARRERWQLSFNHAQQIGKTMSLNGSGSFASDKDFRQDFYSDFDQRTNQTLSATATFRKTFSGSRVLTANIRRLENLQTEQLDFDFPDLSYTQPTRTLIPYRGGRLGGAAWYNNIKYSYETRLKSSASRRATAFDSTGQAISFNNSRRSGWQHTIRPSYSTKILKHFSVTPSMNFTELWVPEFIDYKFVDSLNTVVAADTVNEFRARHLVTGIGLNVRTTMYGLWNIPITPLKVVRHKLDPVVGLRFQPDYSDPGFGYYQSFTDTSGNEIRRDRFAGNVFGSSTPSGKVAGMTFSLNNLFQGKVIRDDEEKKIDLFRVNFNTGYNFAADSLRMADLNTSFQSKPIRNLNMTLNARHSFYKLAANGVTRINQFTAPDLANWNFNLNYSLSLKPPQGDDKDREAPPDTLLDDPLATDVFNRNLREEIPGYQTFEDFEGLNIPWNVDFNFSFRYAENGSTISKNFNVRTNARVKLTKNWSISYNNYIDVLDKEIVNQRFNISRDLHCWVMNFSWSPNPNFSFYRLEIRIKESLLRDLKLTKTAGNTPF